MKDLTVFNVLFKGVEDKNTTFCKAFRTIESSNKWIAEKSEAMGLTIKSTSEEVPPLEYNEDTEMFERDEMNFIPSFYDFRCENKEGNSFYFVIFRQTI